MTQEMILALGRYGSRGERGLFLLFFLLLAGGLAFWLIRRRRNNGPGGGANARSILDDRFARGEIDRAEYDHRRAVLAGDEHIPPAPSSTAVKDRPPTAEPDAPNDA